MPHIFSSLNKATGQVDLIKADSKSQANKFLASNFVIQRADPVQVAEAMREGAKLYDATSILLDKAESEEAVGLETTATAVEASGLAADAEASDQDGAGQ